MSSSKEMKELYLRQMRNKEKNYELQDVTENFLTFLMNETKNKNAGFSMGLLGMRGMGKTHILLTCADTMCRKDSNWSFATWRNKADLASLIRDTWDLPNAVYDAQTLADLPPEKCIIGIDEGVLSAGKSSSDPELKKLAELMTEARHHSYILIICTTKAKLDLEIRQDIDIWVILRTKKSQIKRFDDEDVIQFFAENSDNILLQGKGQAHIISNYLSFPFFGRIQIKKEMLSWWTEDISHNMKNTCPDIGILSEEKLRQTTEQYIEPIIATYLQDRGLFEKRMRIYIKLWAKENNITFQKVQFNFLIEEIQMRLAKMDLNENENLRMKKKALHQKLIASDGDFVKGFSQWVWKRQSNEIVASILLYWIQGYSQEAISKEVHKTKSFVGDIVNYYRTLEWSSDENVEYKDSIIGNFGFDLEDYLALLINLKNPEIQFSKSQNFRSDPDMLINNVIIGSDENFIVTDSVVISIKARGTLAKNRWSLNPEHLCKPEVALMKLKRNCRGFFFLFARNWTPKVIIQDLTLDDGIEVVRQRASQYTVRDLLDLITKT